ncbi:hypothetical protein IE81DRAFT_327806 [Ceraceosorus guamensis]|uniref:Uncharacterized protein n=1 Tax=Ceraceosorus guamensis TaxID=1522189 RepID=A0A316W6Q6_9BASI|nr:hypothetical protein IE81DRAFT_327806 [Ceraceosorus guamensis]PWN45557.1 hypothetical protein IE81DRAFT_327806 [Ceraceosorus guamensis]
MPAWTCQYVDEHKSVIWECDRERSIGHLYKEFRGRTRDALFYELQQRFPLASRMINKLKLDEAKAWAAALNGTPLSNGIRLSAADLLAEVAAFSFVEPCHTARQGRLIVKLHFQNCDEDMGGEDPEDEEMAEEDAEDEEMADEDEDMGGEDPEDQEMADKDQEVRQNDAEDEEMAENEDEEAEEQAEEEDEEEEEEDEEEEEGEEEEGQNTTQDVHRDADPKQTEAETLAAKKAARALRRATAALKGTLAAEDEAAAVVKQGKQHLRKKRKADTEKKRRARKKLEKLKKLEEQRRAAEAKQTRKKELKKLGQTLVNRHRSDLRKKATLAALTLPKPLVRSSSSPPSAAQKHFEARVARYLEKRKHGDVFAWTMVDVLLSLAGYSSNDQVPTPSLDRAFQAVVDVWLKALKSNDCAAPPAAAATITPQSAKAHLGKAFGLVKMDESGASNTLNILLRVAGGLFCARHKLHEIMHQKPTREATALMDLVVNAGTWTILPVLGASSVRIRSLLAQGCSQGVASDFFSGTLPRMPDDEAVNYSSLSDCACAFQQLYVLKTHILDPLLRKLHHHLPPAVHVCDGAVVISLATCLQTASKDRKTLDPLFKSSSIKEHPSWDKGVQIHRKCQETTYYSCPLMKTPALRETQQEETRSAFHKDVLAQLETEPPVAGPSALAELDLTLEHFRGARGVSFITPVKTVDRAIPDFRFGGMVSIPAELQDREAMEAHEHLAALLSGKAP